MAPDAKTTNTKTALPESLQQELISLREENKRLREQTSDVARANVHAAELMVALDKTQQELESRNSQLAEKTEQLAEALVTAQQATAARSTFLANMSHELRTPMNGVLGMAQLLQHTALTVDQGNLVTTIRNSGETLLRVINDILDFTKIESGKMELENIEFDLHNTLANVVDLLSPQAKNKSIELVIHFTAKLQRYVVGDSVRLQQILINLIGNAIKFTEHGSVQIDVLENSLTAGDTDLIFKVKDTGIGIPEEIQEHLFDHFTQADVSTTRIFGGTGLGLAISKQLVNLMGGKIGVRSKSGQGSTFWFTLSLPRTGNRSRSSQTSDCRTKTMASRSPQTLSRQRALVVEDNLINQKVVAGMLKKQDLVVDLVANGSEALARMQETRYDIIFMDCQMPVMDGYQATQEIRKLEEPGKRIPIVALTANAMVGDQEKCLAAGMDDYLSKPLQFEAIIAMLEKWCGIKTL